MGLGDLPVYPQQRRSLHPLQGARAEAFERIDRGIGRARGGQ